MRLRSAARAGLEASAAQADSADLAGLAGSRAIPLPPERPLKAGRPRTRGPAHSEAVGAAADLEEDQAAADLAADPALAAEDQADGAAQVAALAVRAPAPADAT